MVNPGNGFSHLVHVRTIDSIFLYDSYRAKINVNYPDDSWIEGIGSLLGLFNPGNSPMDGRNLLFCCNHPVKYISVSDCPVHFYRSFWLNLFCKSKPCVNTGLHRLFSDYPYF